MTDEQLLKNIRSIVSEEVKSIINELPRSKLTGYHL